MSSVWEPLIELSVSWTGSHALQAPISRNPSAFCENLDDLLIAGDGRTAGRVPPPARLSLLQTVRAALRPRPTLLILRNISGHARTGELVGILGPSGGQPPFSWCAYSAVLG